MNPEEVLDNVICARAHNSEQQMELLSEAAALMSDSRYLLSTANCQPFYSSLIFILMTTSARYCSRIYHFMNRLLSNLSDTYLSIFIL